MAKQNGAGDSDVTAEETVTARDDGLTLNGFGVEPAAAAGDRPEVLIGAAVLGGLILAGVVSRLGR